MKKILGGIILGLVVGAVGTLLWFRPTMPAGKPVPPDKESESHETGLHLTKDQQAAAGIITTNPIPAEIKPEVKAFGRVLDPAPLASLLAEIETARSSATASKKEFERLQTLADNAAARARETAEATAARDRIALEAAQMRLVSIWGKVFAARADLGTLVRALIAQESGLIRVEVPTGEELQSTPTAIRIAPLNRQSVARESEIIGPAPSADPQAQGQAFLTLLADRPPPPGTSVVAWLQTPGASKSGFRIPRGALVQHDAQIFIYVQTADEAFERRRVEVGASGPEGVSLVSGVTAADRVVITGAQQLLSEEFKSAGGGE